MGKNQVIIARDYTNRLIELKKRATIDFIEAGKIFTEIRDNKLWKIEGAESFSSYVSEVGYERTTAYKMMLVYEKFGVDSNPQLQEIGWVKLAKIAPKTTPENKDKMLEMAQLSLSDINAEFRGDCDHEWETIEICKNCGRRRVFESD